MNTLRRYAILLAAAFMCACAANSNRASGRDRSDQSRITAAEVRSADPNLTLFDLISRTRPTWLVKRAGTAVQGQTNVVVYRDDIRVGGPETLREIRLDIVASVRYLTASEASGRFGLNHQHGAILVTTLR